MRIVALLSIFFCAAISLRAQTSVEIDLEEQMAYLLQIGRPVLASPISPRLAPPPPPGWRSDRTIAFGCSVPCLQRTVFTRVEPAGFRPLRQRTLHHAPKRLLSLRARCGRAPVNDLCWPSSAHAKA